MEKCLLLGGPLHGQVKTLVPCNTCEIQVDGVRVLYNREHFVHALTLRTYTIFVHGRYDWESWQVAQLLRQHGLLD